MKVMLTGSNAALGRALSHFWQQKHTDDLLNCPDETCWTSVDKAQRTVETFCPDLLINCPNFGDTGAERQKVPNIGCISRTAFLWEALRQSSFKTDKIILLSSGSIYEDRRGGSDHFSHSGGSGDSYRRSDGLPIFQSL